MVTRSSLARNAPGYERASDSHWNSRSGTSPNRESARDLLTLFAGELVPTVTEPKSNELSERRNGVAGLIVVVESGTRSVCPPGLLTSMTAVLVSEGFGVKTTSTVHTAPGASRAQSVAVTANSPASSSVILTSRELVSPGQTVPRTRLEVEVVIHGVPPRPSPPASTTGCPFVLELHAAAA
jgi:hypothetical protein